jgi:organic hydroperoxide reductase OsmC/OhrA
MSSTIAQAKIRSPEAILQAMDKDGVRDNSNLLTQLSAELSVSLAKEADTVSRRNLKIANISCFVAVIALIISVVQIFAH